jgi:hypothetical protein
MNPGDYKFDEKSTIKITTKDSVYNFSGDDYYMVNDSLRYYHYKKLDEKTTLKSNVGIPVENIESVEVDRTDVLATVLITFGVVVGVFFVGFLDL